MQKSTLALAVASVLAGFATPALAQTTYGDTARVVSATPITEHVVVKHECVVASSEGAAAAPCQTGTASGDRVVGYDVRYEYNGREFSIRMPYDPGPQMAVNVEVRPPMPAPPRDAVARPRTPNYRGTY